MKAYVNVFVIVSSFALLSCSQAQKQVDQNQTPSEAEQVSSKTEPSIKPMPLVSDSNCMLKMGFDVWEPYQFKNVDNTVQGLDIELITAVTDAMSCKVEFVQGTWVELLDSLQNGEVDLLLGASKTKSREEFAYFSEPYRSEEYMLYIRADDAIRAGYSDVQEFIDKGSTIGLVGDYYYGDNISDMLDDAATADQFKFAIMGELNIARLLDMDIDGFLEDSFVGASMLRRKNLGEYIKAHDFTINTGDIYVMFSQKSVTEEQVLTFNQALVNFKTSGEYKQILEKYGR
jgi:polar amino acid transport system substrate-binding protein